MGPITEIEGDIFGIKPNTLRPYEYYDDVHIALSYEFDLNLYRIDREAYNMLDWLGDLGGLKEALIIIFGFTAGLFNYHKLENFMVSHVYRAETRKDRLHNKLGRSTNSIANEEDDIYLRKQEGVKL